MALEDPRRRRSDSRFVGDVARLRLCADLARDGPQPVPAARQHAPPAAPGERPRGRLPIPDDAPVTTATRCIVGEPTAAEADARYPAASGRLQGLRVSDPRKRIRDMRK